jgi:hypothetical protein
VEERTRHGRLSFWVMEGHGMAGCGATQRSRSGSATDCLEVGDEKFNGLSWAGKVLQTEKIRCASVIEKIKKEKENGGLSG